MTQEQPSMTSTKAKKCGYGVRNVANDSLQSCKPTGKVSHKKTEWHCVADTEIITSQKVFTPSIVLQKQLSVFKIQVCKRLFTNSTKLRQAY
ncbi:hypothetical protein TNCV_3745441 [Trichonephila clavipes]|nr:hypothetical protein TNCV_3745441 [Trichonephila clavipes]